MIYKPGELKFSDQKFSVLLYGPPGVGKTTLAASAPNALLIDLDEGIQRVNARHHVPYIQVNSYEDLLNDLNTEEAKSFETIILDTGGAFVTLLQDYVMRKDPVNRTKSGTISQKGFGAVKAEFTQFMNRLKTVLKKNIVYVFHSIEEKNKDGNPIQRLLCEGSAKNIVWQPCDFGIFLYKNGTQTYGGFTPTDEYFAKGCYGINGVREIPFGETVKNDFLARLFNEAKGNIAKDREYFDAEKSRYDQVMTEGQKLIEEVITPDQAMGFTAKVKQLPHALTSLDELRTLFREHLTKMGIEWNRESRKYEYVKKDTTKQETPAECAETAQEANNSKPDKQPEKATKEADKPVAHTETVSIEDIIAAEERKNSK